MGQVANTLRLNPAKPPAAIISLARQGARSHRLVDSIVLMVLLSSSLAALSIYWRTASELGEARTRREAIRGRVDQLLIDTGRLEQEIDQLHTDSVLIETLARQNLGMVRPGDIVISLRMEQPSSATLMADREGATESPSTGHLGSPALNSQHSKPVREGLVGTAIGGRP